MKLTKSRSCALRNLPSAPARKKDGISKRRIPRPLLQVKNLQRRRFHSTLEVKAEDCTTVRDLKERIGIQHSLSVIMLLYRGVPLDDARLLEHFLPDLPSGPPRFGVHTRVRPHTIHNGVTVNVLDLNRKTFQVTLHSPNSTLMELKEAIRDYEGMSLDHIAVTYAGKQLTRDDYTLRECKIEQGCTVNLVGRLRGGFRPSGCGQLDNALDLPQPVGFADLEDTSLSCKVRLNSRAKEWRICVEGLNVEGECWNEDCIAFRQMVIDPRGFTVFNLREPAHCPSCKVAIRPLTCGFRKCLWMFEGRKTGVGALYIESQFMKAGTNYERFEEAADGRATAEWSSLIITAQKLPSKENMKAFHGSGECPICHEEFTDQSSQVVTAKCSHAFHYECVMEWQMRGNINCPMCRASLD
ncbi:hypothetical protein KC19_10G158800 [Ceratodon purpureus]|uniref:Uncharacterized protein n=1 Tax=Ceratodon purpureus TaxID=3225 RepID=A0A8T0GNU7_CERPU|nr:hypothetical protein KC19_10G158800 [Ceratodon purpureus]